MPITIKATDIQWQEDEASQKTKRNGWEVISISSRARHDFISKAVFLVFFYSMLYSEIMPFHSDRSELTSPPRPQLRVQAAKDQDDGQKLFTLHKHTFLFYSINEICLLKHGASLSATFFTR